MTVPTTFPFAFDPTYRRVDRLLGVTESSAGVTLEAGQLDARFGPWQVRTPLSNVEGVEITGPFSLPKTIGPPHVSLRDRGLTFATNHDRGVCVRFRQPVGGVEPIGVIRHPGLTVTVADCEGLAAAIRAAAAL